MFFTIAQNLLVLNQRIRISEILLYNKKCEHVMAPSSNAYLDMILQSSILSQEGGFRGVCRLVHGKMKSDEYFMGKQPKTIAYLIFINTMDEYFKDNYRPMTRKDAANIIGKRSLSGYSNLYPENRGKYQKFQKRIFALIEKMKKSK